MVSLLVAALSAVGCDSAPVERDAAVDAARSRHDAAPSPDAPVVELLDAMTLPTECTSDFARPRPPLRLVAPASGGRATTRRPAFRWATTLAGSATIEVCSDRRCAAPITTMTSAGSTTTPTSDLPPGRAFWRVSVAPADGSPAVTSATWQVRIPIRSTPVDTSWPTGLDLDEDGLDDLVVTANEARSYWGNVFVYLDDPLGFPTLPTAIVWEGANDVFSAGDLDGDGHGDFVTQGAPSGPILNFGDDGGIVAVRTHTLGDRPSPTSIASAGDVDGDGYADLVAFSAGARALLVFAGDAGGPGCSPTQTIATATYWTRLAGIGDANGDGFADVAAVRENMDRSFDLSVWYGSASGLGSPQIVHGPVFFAGAGDVDGDGYADVVADMVTATPAVFSVQVFVGSAAGLASTPAQSLTPPSDGGTFGHPIAIVGDVDGDGFDDLAVGSPQRATSFPPPRSLVYVYPGSAEGIDPTRGTALSVSGLSFDTVIRSSETTGDDIDDLVIGVPAAPPVGDVLVFPGRTGGVSTTPSVTLSCPDTEYAFGSGVACAPRVRPRSDLGSRSDHRHRSASNSSDTG